MHDLIPKLLFLFCLLPFLQLYSSSFLYRLAITIILVVSISKVAKVVSVLRAKYFYVIQKLISWTIWLGNIFCTVGTWGTHIRCEVGAMISLLRQREVIIQLNKKWKIFTMFLQATVLKIIAFVKKQVQYFVYLPNETPPEEWRKRKLLIVSTRYGKSYKVLREIMTELEAFQPQIDWHGHELSSIPTMLNLPTSIRHFSVCLMPLDVWNNSGLTLIDKFRDCTYWELIGPDLVPSDGECGGWRTEKIIAIDTVLDVGVTTYCNDTITMNFYRPLRALWISYETVWWNSFDFAIRLAGLIFCDANTKELLTIHREKIEQVRREEDERMRAAFNYNNLVPGLACMASGISVTGSVGMGGVVIASPVIAPAAVVAGIGLLGIGLMAGNSRSSSEPTFMRTWRERSRILEMEFPRLKGLINWKKENKWWVDAELYISRSLCDLS